MGRPSALKAIFGSEARQRLLQCLCANPDDEFQLRALASQAGVDVSQAHKLIRKFSAVGLCRQTATGSYPRYKATANVALRQALSALFEIASHATSQNPMQRIEERSLRLHEAAAAHLRRDPQALERAKQTLRRWVSQYRDNVPADLTTWQQILSKPLPQIIETALQRTQYGNRIRKSSPLSTLVTREERRNIYASR